MGGAASPLGWNMGYDPIISAVSDTVRAPTPTFVDDLAAHVLGAAQAVALQLFLIATGAIAGLLARCHTCRWVEVDALPHDVCAALRRFPLDIHPLANERVSIAGLPPWILARLLVGLGVALHLLRARECTRPCHCKIKTCLVPARGYREWRAAMRFSPFGCEAAAYSWPYLGIQAVSSAFPLQPNASTPTARELARDGAWDRATTKHVIRADTTAAAGGSLAIKTTDWNTYHSSLSLSPYAALSTPPPYLLVPPSRSTASH